MTDAPSEYHARKDDPEEWGEALPRPAAGKRKLAAMVSVRFSPEEEQLIRAEAERRHKSLSGFIREQTLAALTPAHEDRRHGEMGTSAGASRGGGSIGTDAVVIVGDQVLTSPSRMTGGNLVASTQ